MLELIVYKLKQFLIEFCMGNAKGNERLTLCPNTDTSPAAGTENPFVGPNEAISMHVKWAHRYINVYVHLT